MRKILLTASLSLLVLDAIACSGGDSSPIGTIDGSTPDAQASDAQTSDAQTSDAQTSDAQTDAPSSNLDGGSDGTVTDSGTDGSASDAASDADADTHRDGGDADAAIDCPTLIANMMSANVSPPNQWINLDLSKGGPADGGAGGLTIDQAGILACASSVEPTTLEPDAVLQPGMRTATFDGPQGSIQVSFNLESRVIGLVQLSAPKSSLTFHSRAGGAYEGDAGSNVYVITFATGVDGGTDGGSGSVTKNGKDFPADWTRPVSGGTSHASAWANEIYDGLMATFAPAAPAVDDCLAAPTTLPNGVERVSSCLFNPDASGDILGVRPLGFYLVFADGTNQARSMYQFYWPGYPTCATPLAATERRDSLPISATGNRKASLGPLWQGVNIGSLSAAEPIANSAGLLASEANTIAGCGGVSVTAREPGYSAEQWGPSGEVELEYNADSGVAYKVFAKQGYAGKLDIVSTSDDGGTTNEYVIAPGTLTRNGAAMTLDWAGDSAALNAKITDISNAWLADYCDGVDTDCVAAGSCTIVPNDGNGHSTFTLLSSPDVAMSCGDRHPLTFVFAQGTSVPIEIYATNPGGK